MQSGLTPYNEATGAVIRTLSGVRSHEEVVAEFYGLPVSAVANTESLAAHGVRWHPRLAALGVDAQAFMDITGLPADEPAPSKSRRRKEERAI